MSRQIPEAEGNEKLVANKFGVAANYYPKSVILRPF